MTIGVVRCHVVSKSCRISTCKSILGNVTHLSKTFLSRPDRGVNDLQEQLACTRVEDEDGAVDGLGGQIAFKRLEQENKNICNL